jgi:hypothetical protein
MKFLTMGFKNKRTADALKGCHVHHGTPFLHNLNQGVISFFGRHRPAFGPHSDLHELIWVDLATT